MGNEEKGETGTEAATDSVPQAPTITGSTGAEHAHTIEKKVKAALKSTTENAVLKNARLAAESAEHTVQEANSLLAGGATGNVTAEAIKRFNDAKTKLAKDNQQEKELLNSADVKQVKKTEQNIVERTEASVGFLNAKAAKAANVVAKDTKVISEQLSQTVKAHQEKLSEINKLTMDAQKQFEMQKAALQKLTAQMKIAQANLKLMQPSLEKERIHIIQKAKADALKEGAEIQKRALKMATEIQHEARKQAVKHAHEVLLTARQERAQAAAALAEAKSVRDMTEYDRKKQQAEFTKTLELAVQREKIADQYNSQAKQVMEKAEAEARESALKQIKNMQKEE